MSVLQHYEARLGVWSIVASVCGPLFLWSMFLPVGQGHNILAIGAAP